MSKSFIRAVFIACAATAACASHNGAVAAEPVATALRPLFPREAQGVVGTYRLSDGRSLSLRQHGGAVVARLGREPAAKLLAAPTATGWQLQAPDGHLQISFELDLNGQARRIAVTTDCKACTSTQQAGSATAPTGTPPVI
jgi:hypothetical protein